MKIAFIINTKTISGGMNIIFEYAARLKNYSHQINVICTTPYQSNNFFWHDQAPNISFVEIGKLDTKYDIVIATAWETVFHLHQVESDHYAYFVQAMESRFYVDKGQAIKNWINSTYKFNVSIITSANWIKSLLEQNYSKNSSCILSGIRKDFFSVSGDKIAELPRSKLRVLVEGPLGVPTKNVEKTIELCSQAEVGEIWLLTSTAKDSELFSCIKNVDKIFSKILPEQCGAVYRSCDVLVKLSYAEGMFAPPLEMFHCGGTAIAYDVNGHEEYMENNINSIVIPMGEESKVVEQLKILKNDRNKLDRLKAGALETAKNWRTWDQATEEFEKTLHILKKQSSATQNELAEMTNAETRKYLLERNKEVKKNQ